MTCYKNIVYGPEVTRGVDGTFTGSNVTNVVIPATGKSTLHITPILGEDNVQVAFYRYTLTFESLIYEQNQVLGDMELEIKRIRTILSTPSLQLSIWPVGLGELPIVNSVGFPDLTGGPFPENINVAPLASNNAIVVSGTIRFDISHCSPYIARDLVQYNSGVEYTISEEGNISFIVDTTYQSRTPIINKASLNALGAEISRNAGKVFVGFKRRTRLSFSRDQRVARIKTELSEIPSDAAFAPFTKHIDFNDEIDGSIHGGAGMFEPGGFYKWNRTMNCTVTLPQRVNKIWGWYVFKQLLLHRLKGIRSINKENGIPDVNTTTAQTTELNNVDKKKAWYLLTHFKIVNPLFSRTITFEAKYIFTMTLNDILSNKSNIFTTVRHNIAPKVAGDPPVPVEPEEMVTYDPNTTANKDLSDEWDYWNKYDEKSLSGIYSYIASGPIVYAQCAVSLSDPLPSKLSIGANKNSFNEQEPTPATPYQSSKDIKDLTGVFNDPKKSWIKYDNSTEIIQVNNNEQIDYIQDTPLTNYQAIESTAPVSATAGFQINHETSGAEDSLQLPATVAFGSSTNKIRMKGYAVRIGHKIPCPAIISYDNSPVQRVGVSRFEHKVLSLGSVMTISPEDPEALSEIIQVPIYLAMWDVTYAINKNIRFDDILSKIKSSGATAVYET